MIIETLAALAIQTAIPGVPIHHMNNVGMFSPAPVFAAYSSRSSFSSSRSS